MPGLTWNLENSPDRSYDKLGLFIQEITLILDIFIVSSSYLFVQRNHESFLGGRKTKLFVRRHLRTGSGQYEYWGKSFKLDELIYEKIIHGKSTSASARHKHDLRQASHEEWKIKQIVLNLAAGNQIKEVRTRVLARVGDI